MTLNPKWIPIKWQCGPVESARLNEFNRGDVELKEMVEAWTQPSALRLLKGSPINCLVVDWATGTAADAGQQQALKPLIHAGRQLGLSFVGKVSAMENLAAVVTAGREAGLEAVILKGSGNWALDLPFIVQFPNDHIDWDVTTAIFSATGNIWPKANLKIMDEGMDGDTASAGPTGNPWVDSNGWLSLLASQMVPGKVLWLDIDPPDSRDILPGEEYCLAIADSRVYGGSRWMISLDGKMRAALLKKDQSAMDAWTRICQTLSFFEDHSAWDKYEPMGILAVVSDFRGQNAYASGEVLNLLNRRQFQFSIMDRTRALVIPKEWLKGILWMDEEAPNSEQHNQLLAFVQQGGLLIAAKYWGPSGVIPSKEDWLFGYDIYDVSKGRIVVAVEGLSDPYKIARDAHLLVTRRNDFVRVYNPGTTKYISSIDSARLKQVVQVLNYSTEVANYVTLWVDTRARSATLWSPKSGAPLPIGEGSANEGTSFDIPPLSVNCAVEIERLA